MNQNTPPYRIFVSHGGSDTYIDEQFIKPKILNSGASVFVDAGMIEYGDDFRVPAVASTGGHRRLPCAGELLPEGEGHALSSLTSRVATPPASSRSRAIALSTAWRSAGVMARSRTSSRTRSSWRGAVRAMCLQASSVLRASGNRASILCLLAHA